MIIYSLFAAATGAFAIATAVAFYALNRRNVDLERRLAMLESIFGIDQLDGGGGLHIVGSSLFRDGVPAAGPTAGSASVSIIPPGPIRVTGGPR